MTDKEVGPLGHLFNQVILNLKNGPSVWEEFLGKTSRLCATLRATIAALSAFLEAFQKIADLATNTRGSTREVGMLLTKLCLRHRVIEKKLSDFTEALSESLINQVQSKMEDWRKAAGQLDKEHSREIKKVRADIKKMSTNTLKLQKKGKMGKTGTLERAASMKDDSSVMYSVEIAEERAVRATLLEEHRQYCFFISGLSPALEKEMSLLEDLSQLRDIATGLHTLTRLSTVLPASTEQAILDMKSGLASVDVHSILTNSSTNYNLQANISTNSNSSRSPPPSPPSLGSRQSSLCSISSTNSSSSGSALGRRLHTSQSMDCGGGRALERSIPTPDGLQLSTNVSIWANWPGRPLPASNNAGKATPTTTDQPQLTAPITRNQSQPHLVSDEFSTNPVESADYEQLTEFSNECFDGLLADLSRYATLPRSRSFSSQPLVAKKPLTVAHYDTLASNKPSSDQQSMFKRPPQVPRRQSSVIHSQHANDEPIYQEPQSIYKLPESVYSLPKPANSNYYGPDKLRPPLITMAMRKTSLDNLNVVQISSSNLPPTAVITFVQGQGQGQPENSPESLSPGALSQLPLPPDDFFTDSES